MAHKEIFVQPLVTPPLPETSKKNIWDAILTLGLLKLLGTTYVTGDCAIAQPDPSITVFGERRRLSLRSLGPQSLYRQDEGLERFSFLGLVPL